MHHTPILLSCWFVLMTVLTFGTSQTVPPKIPANVLPVSKDGLTIEANAKEVVPSVTKHLSVQCSFSKLHNKRVALLFSLILSRWDNPSQSVQEILTITSLDPHQVQQLQPVRGKVEGSLDATGNAFISIVWDYPSKSVATKYICEFHGSNKIGRHVEAEVGLEITASDLDFSKIAEELRLLEEWREGQVKLNQHINNSQEVQNNVLNKLDRINAAQNHTIRRLRNTVGGLSNFLDQQNGVNAAQNDTIDVLTNTQDRQEKMISALDRTQKMQNRTLQHVKIYALGYDTQFKDVEIDTSSIVIDQQNLFWAKQQMDFTQGQKLCWVKGGKLAEFTFEQLKAVEPQLKADGLTCCYWIGLRRDEHNRNWYWASDGRDAGPITWWVTPSYSHDCVTFQIEAPGYYPKTCSKSKKSRVLCAASDQLSTEG